jgi:hypothetical protein
LPFGIADGALVIFGDAELEVLGSFGEILLQFLEVLELALDVGALP